MVVAVESFVASGDGMVVAFGMIVAFGMTVVEYEVGTDLQLFVPLDDVLVVLASVVVVASVEFQLVLVSGPRLPPDSPQLLPKEVVLLHDIPESFEKRCFSSARCSLDLKESRMITHRIPMRTETTNLAKPRRRTRLRRCIQEWPHDTDDWYQEG